MTAITRHNADHTRTMTSSLRGGSLHAAPLQDIPPGMQAALRQYMQSARDRARSAPDDGSNEWDLSEEVEDPRERGHANPPEASVDSSSIDTTTHADLDSPAVASTMTNDVPEALANGTDSSVLTVLGSDPLSLQFSRLLGEDAVSEFPIMAGSPDELAKLLDEVHWEETKSAIKRAAQGRQLK